MGAEVESYAGYDYPERPRALIWEGQRLEVCEVLAQASRPEGRWFRVKTGDERVFDLLYHHETACWEIAET